MKISALLSLAFACTVSASTYGQNYKLSMNKQDCSISEVLKEIEKNSEYTFFLNDNQVNVNRKTSVKANNASLEEVLEQALKNTGYQYEIVDRQIIIKSKSVSSVSHPNALFQSSPRKMPWENPLSGRMLSLKALRTERLRISMETSVWKYRTMRSW